MRVLPIASLTLVVVLSGALFGQDSKSTEPSSDRDQTMDRPADNADAQHSRAATEVPEGTQIVVRTDQTIDSTVAREGQSYSAVVQEAVTGPDGQTLIPKGSEARLTIRQISTGGTTGSPQLVLGLESINIDGHRYLVNSADAQQGGNRGIGKNRRTGEYVGGGAVLGTLLGAIAGGGKGAAIGAVAGAAAGGTAQVLTKGKEVDSGGDEANVPPRSAAHAQSCRLSLGFSLSLG